MNVPVNSTAREIAKSFVVSKCLPDFESYLSLKKIEEVICLHSYYRQQSIQQYIFKVIEKAVSQDRTIYLIMSTYPGLRGVHVTIQDARNQRGWASP